MADVDTIVAFHGFAGWSLISSPEFSQVIRSERLKLGLTQRELADRIGVSDSYVAHLEGGAKAPSIHVCMALSSAFGFTADEQAAFLESVDEARIDRSRRRIRKRGDAVRAALRTQSIAEGAARLRLVEIETGREARVLPAYAGAVSSVALSGDRRRAVWGCADHTLRVWNLGAGREEGVLRGHTGAVTAVAMTGSGLRAISGSTDGTVRIWDVERREEAGVLGEHGSEVTTVAITMGGGIGASGARNEAVCVWDLESEPSEKQFVESAGTPEALALSPDGEILAVAAAGAVALISVASGQKRRVLAGPTQKTAALAFHTDGAGLTGLSSDGETTVWDIGTGAVRVRRRLEGGAIVAIPASAHPGVVAIYEAGPTQDREAVDLQRIARELTEDPHLLAAHMHLRVLSRSPLRETAFQTLRALAESASRSDNA